MSETNDLAEFFGLSGNQEYYDQLREFTNEELLTAMQHTKVSAEEITQYSDYLLLAEQFDIEWLRNVVQRDVLLKKSESGWMVGIKADILKRMGGYVDEAQSAVGTVSTAIKDAFSS